MKRVCELTVFDTIRWQGYTWKVDKIENDLVYLKRITSGKFNSFFDIKTLPAKSREWIEII